MTFGNKIKTERRALGLTQDELASRIGVSRRVVTSYENDKSRPRGADGYKRLAAALNVNVNYLLSEDDAFVVKAGEKYGTEGALQAKRLIEEVNGLFSGGEMDEADMDEMMLAIQEAYWIAKKKHMDKRGADDE